MKMTVPDRVLRALARDDHGMTAAQLTEAVKTTADSTSSAIRLLREEELVVVAGVRGNTGGRWAQVYCLPSQVEAAWADAPVAERILDALDEPKTVRQIAEIIKVRYTSTINALRRLEADGEVRREGPEKHMVWSLAAAQ